MSMSNPRVDARSSGATGVVVGLVALLVVAHLVAVVAWLGEPGRLPLVHQLAGLAASVLGISGTLAAARTFAPEDHLRRVWALYAVGASLLFVASALRVGWMVAVPDVDFFQSPLATPRTVLIVLLNVFNSVAPVLLVLTYRRSGLVPPRTVAVMALYAVGALLALLVVRPVLVRTVGHFQAHGYSAEVTANVASIIGDLFTLGLIAPILRVAYMLRGGRLSWPWWAMAASGVAWIVFDVRPTEHADAAALFYVARTAAIALVGASGLLQRAALAPEATAADAPATA
jgi:hypothetical protein